MTGWESERLAEFRALHLKLRLWLMVHDPFVLRQLIEGRQIDLALVSKAVVRNLKDVHFKTLFRLKNMAMVSEKHPLAGERVLTRKQLDAYDLINLHPRLIPFYAGKRLQEYLLLHTQSHKDFLVENETAALFMASGYGAAILPETCLPQSAEGLRVLPLLDETGELEYGICYFNKNEVIEEVIRGFMGKQRGGEESAERPYSSRL